jgi:hypothetical protein
MTEEAEAKVRWEWRRGGYRGTEKYHGCIDNKERKQTTTDIFRYIGTFQIFPSP